MRIKSKRRLFLPFSLDEAVLLVTSFSNAAAAYPSIEVVHLFLITFSLSFCIVGSPLGEGRTALKRDDKVERSNAAAAYPSMALTTFSGTP